MSAADGAFAGPLRRGGHWLWEARGDGVRAIFAGAGAKGTRDEVLSRVAGRPLPLAWAKQVHSSTVLAAAPGACGEGDALVTREPCLALAVATADCVPVLLAGPEGVAAVHAGWRGLAAGVLPAAVRAATPVPSRWTAWIGPAIGPCCYEVGEDVAERVAAASNREVLTPGAAGRPHLDLPGAAHRQLASAGLGAILLLRHCTRCDPERLASYRRDGQAAGRNYAYVWREPAA
ncbi:MAG TPA: peptidoglycan editing factor PgeF [Thermoanaerobaculia bacterium]|nr:peptidoglycan editing factor PgeF [Thermoanaerobaculia bacterium]